MTQEPDMGSQSIAALWILQIGICLTFASIASFRLGRSARLALRFFRHGPPEIAKQLLAKEAEPGCAVRAVHLLGYGKVIFVSR